MFQYYRNAYQCYVYLEDIDAAESPDYRSSRWFTRSWTLQELIAPKSCIFYDRVWAYVGEKSSLGHHLSSHTGIDIDVLRGTKSIAATSIATRMSWAAGRKATREEDIAYSLLGLFDVNMPLLYGEGSKAFIRLQEEIMKESNDQSIFAWGPIWSAHLRKTNIALVAFPGGNAYIQIFATSLSLDREEGFLASSPDAFKTESEIISYTMDRDHTWITTNKGIQVSFPMLCYDKFDLFLLNCYIGSNLGHRIAICSNSGPGNVRKRAQVGIWLVENHVIDHKIKYDQQFFWSKNEKLIVAARDREDGVFVDIESSHGCRLSEVMPVQMWDQAKRIFRRSSPAQVCWRVGFSIVSSLFLAPQLYVCVFIDGAEFGCRVMENRVDWLASLGYWEDPDIPRIGEGESELGGPSAIAFSRPSYQKTVALHSSRKWGVMSVSIVSKDVMGQQMYVVRVEEELTTQERTFKDKGGGLGWSLAQNVFRGLRSS